MRRSTVVMPPLQTMRNIDHVTKTNNYILFYFVLYIVAFQFGDMHVL